MIIYPSESFAKGQELSKKKLNTYFELTESKVPSVKDSLFSEEGVTAYIDDENNAEKYEYVILPLVDYVCFEVFNGESNSIEVKKLITQWREYVQAARSHNSLYADVCSWKNVSFELNDEQQKTKNKIEALVLTDELCELDDIVRVLCGLSVNKAPKTLSPFELANTIASNYIDIAKNRSAQQKLAHVEVEASMLQEKNDKLSSDLSASQSVIAKKNEQLQEAQQHNDSLKENTLKLTTSFEARLEKAGQQAAQLNEEINALNQNNLKKVAELEALTSEKAHLSERLEEEKNKNSKLAEALENAEQQTSNLKLEIELCQLQIAQLQEELEAVFNDKVKGEKAFEEKLKDTEHQLKLALEKQYAIQQESVTAVTNNTDELHNALAENELMQLQILQLQEELEFYFEKASSTQTTVEPIVLQEEILTDDVAKAATQKHNTLSLIGRLMNASGRGDN
ncbi:hypothetical protein JC525_07135 [Alteromonas sp. IB21]|uniref:hypothetical protein n=1 Tax=Alteromonas sp. IB21 TaxID=2779369 RepID=UPI0018E774BC|nr:hypothetical protein [Alteromonas sp. IB21]MBJ2128708.1 hypothetical protein [Alteromonas sp. IB21]